MRIYCLYTSENGKWHHENQMTIILIASLWIFRLCSLALEWQFCQTYSLSKLHAESMAILLTHGVFCRFECGDGKCLLDFPISMAAIQISKSIVPISPFSHFFLSARCCSKQRLSPLLKWKFSRFVHYPR